MKRRISLLLAVVMVLGSFAAFAATDVELEKAKFLESNKVLLGNTAGDLLLDENMKRQDSVVMLSRLLGKESEAKETKESEAFGKFTDTPKNDKYYNGFISWALENEFFVGHTAERFGYNENITARDYSVVLLRALGYGKEAEGAEGWKSAYTTANTLGLLKDVTAKEADEITRGQMAVMTFNALGTKVKGSDKTLAETLGITMPAADKLTAKVNDTVSLAEVIVELSNVNLVNKDKAELASNYKIAGYKVKFVEIDGNNVILSLDDALVKNKEYTLTVRGIDKEINKDYKFKALDNTLPEVVSATALGEYGIKVVTTETVRLPQERNFTIDGKRVSMKIEQYGRTVILTPYSPQSQSFPTGEQKLTISELVDYAGYKSVSQDFDITVEKDNEGPKVVDSTVSGDRVTVTFDKPVFKASLAKYESRRSLGNASYRYRNTDFYAEGVEKIAENKVVYTFGRELPANQEVTIEGVQNHSKVAMEKQGTTPRVVKDDVAPYITNNSKRLAVAVENDDEKGKVITENVSFEIEFDKDMQKEFAVKDHFALYDKDVKKSSKIADGADLEKYITVERKNDDNKNVLVVTLLKDKFTVNNDNKDYDYVLEVFDLKDTNGVKMELDYVDFEVVTKASAYTVELTDVATAGTRRTEVVFKFSKAVNKSAAEDKANYLFSKGSTTKDVADLDGTVYVENDGKKVTLSIPMSRTDLLGKYEFVEVLRSVTDANGNRLPAGKNTFRLDQKIVADKELEELEELKAKAIVALSTLDDYAKTDGVTNENLDKAKPAYEAAKAAVDTFVEKGGKTSDLTKFGQLEATKKNIEAVEKANVDKENAKNALDLAIRDTKLITKVKVAEKAELVDKDVQFVTQEEMTAYETAITTAEGVLAKTDATTEEYTNAKTALETAVTTYKAAIKLGTKNVIQ